MRREAHEQQKPRAKRGQRMRETDAGKGKDDQVGTQRMREARSSACMQQRRREARSCNQTGGVRGRRVSPWPRRRDIDMTLV